MASPRRSPPPPLEGNDRLITAVITSGWAIALVVVLIFRGSIPAAERWWIWTCVTGVALGVFGLWYVPRLKRSRAQAAVRRAARFASRGGQEGAVPPEGAASPSGAAPEDTEPAGGVAPMDGVTPPAAGPRSRQDPPENDSKTVSSSETPGRSTRS